MTANPEYSRIFDLLDTCVIVMDLEGRVTGWNSAAETVYGVGRKYAIGMALDDLFVLPAHAGPQSALTSAWEWAGTIDRVVKGVSGSTTVSVTSTLQRDGDGRPVAIVEMSRPVLGPETPKPCEDLAPLFTAAGFRVVRLDATEASRSLAALPAKGVLDVRHHLHGSPDLIRQLMLSFGIEKSGSTAEGPALGLAFSGSTGGFSSWWPEESTHSFIDLMVTVLVEGTPAHSSCKLMCENGALFDAEITAVPASAAAGDAGLLLAIRDVSVEREAFAALEASELRYRHLFEYMPIALTQVDASELVEIFTDLRRQGVTDLSTYIDEHPEFMDVAMAAMHVEQVNQTNADLFAASSRDDMRGPITRYWDAGLPTLRRSLEARYRGENFFQEEAQLRRLDGAIVDVLYAAARHSTLPNKSLVAFMDISDRKQAEQALRRSERRYQDLFQAMTVSFWELDLTGVHEAFQGAGPVPGDIAGYLEAHPRRVAEILASSRIVDVNDQTLSLFGGTKKADLLKTLDCFWSPDRSIDGAAAVLTILTSDESVTIETRLRRLTGEEFDAQFTLWFSTDDRCRGLAAVTDISERVNAFNKLEQSEQRFRDLFQHLPVPVLQVNSASLMECLGELKDRGVADLKAHMADNPEFLWTAMENTVIEQANDAALKVLGASEPRDLQGPITPLWRHHPEVYARLLQNRYLDLATYEEEVTLTTFDGRTREGMLTVTFPPALAKLGVTINAFVDTTEKKQAERRLRQIEAEYAHAARIAMLGELAASIAHEVNQPLAAITTYGEAGLRWLSRPEPELAEVREIVTRIVADAERAANVISRVRSMASHRTQDEGPVALDELVAEVVLFLKHEFQLHNVKVSHLGSADAERVNGDRIQLQQVIVNLLVNAVQAMSTTNPERRAILLRTIKEGPHVRCSVEDAGPGIAEEAATKIFESFFTTKDGGMGIGLPISRSIIEAHGGRMDADNSSSLGGARFSFVLPVLI